MSKLFLRRTYFCYSHWLSDSHVREKKKKLRQFLVFWLYFSFFDRQLCFGNLEKWQFSLKSVKLITEWWMGNSKMWGHSHKVKVFAKQSFNKPNNKFSPLFRMCSFHEKNVGNDFYWWSCDRSIPSSPPSSNSGGMYDMLGPLPFFRCGCLQMTLALAPFSGSIEFGGRVLCRGGRTVTSCIHSLLSVFHDEWWWAPFNLKDWGPCFLEVPL